VKIEPIPGFKALKFKEEAQARVLKELEGLSREERIEKMRRDVEAGPFGDLVRKWRAAKIARAKAELEREEREEAA